MLDLVPFAGAGREVAHHDGEPCGVRKSLELDFPLAKPIAIAPSSVGGDQELAGFGVEALALEAPPAMDRGDSEGTRVVIRSDVDETCVSAEIVDPIGIRAWHRGCWEVVTVHLVRIFRLAPLAASIHIVSDQLLLLRVDGHDRQPTRERLGDFLIDVLELRVPIRVVVPLFGLPVTLKAVLHQAEKLRHLFVADRVTLCGQFRGQDARALARPAQGRLRVATGKWLHQPFEGARQIRVVLNKSAAPTTRAANSSGRQWRLVKFLHSLHDRHARQTTSTTDHRHATIAALPRFTRRHHPSRPLVQMRPH